ESRKPHLFALAGRLAAEKKRRPEPAPLVPFVERDRRIDEAVVEPVERARDGAARGNALVVAQDLLAFAREQEVDEEERRVRMRRSAREADGARLAEGGLGRPPR